MIDNILFQDNNGLILDIDVVHVGSNSHVLFDKIMQTIPTGSSGNYAPIKMTTPIAIKYLNKILYRLIP